jgi:hypothetical protein
MASLTFLPFRKESEFHVSRLVVAGLWSRHRRVLRIACNNNPDDGISLLQLLCRHAVHRECHCAAGFAGSAGNDPDLQAVESSLMV